ncbi:ankyrin [Gordonia phage GTE2]|uniref:Ankyrin n=1 Tax=Gordonia phage GTE2 TaxID=981323 RepID=F8S0W6_9CAUD|nr:ankyrin [Gordonia phage GTE2]ADX42641.1 ankyrin [Gordonia phage GTE2]
MTVPYLRVTASQGADVPDSIELHNRQAEMHWEVELLEKLQAAGVVVRRQDSGGSGEKGPVIYDLFFKNGSWVYQAVGYSEGVTGSIVILQEVEERGEAGNES